MEILLLIIFTIFVGVAIAAFTDNRTQKDLAELDRVFDKAIAKAEANVAKKKAAKKAAVKKTAKKATKKKAAKKKKK